MIRTLCYATLIFFTIALLLQTYENAATPYFLGGDVRSNMIASQRLYHEQLTAHPVRPFLYPALIGLPFLWSSTEGELHGGFTVSQVYFGVALNFMAWLLTVVLLFKTLRIWGLREQWARWACCVFAANVGTVFNNFQLLTEPIFTFLLFAHIHTVILFFLKKQTKYVYFSAMFLSLSALVRPTTLPIAVFLMPIYLFFLGYKKQLSLPQIAIATSLILIILGSQVMLMKRTFGEYQFSYIRQWGNWFFLGAYAAHFNESPSIEGKTQLWKAEYAHRHAVLNQPDINMRDGWKRLDSLVKQDLTQLVTQKPSALLGTLIRNFASNATAPSPDFGGLQNMRQRSSYSWVQKIALIISRCQNIFYSSVPFLLLAFYFYYYRKIKIPTDYHNLLIYNWFLTIYITGISSIVFTQGDRYHIVVVPLILLFTPFLSSYWNKTS